MNFNFRKELEEITPERFVNDDVERSLKSIIDHFYNNQISFSDIKWIKFKVICKKCICELYLEYSDTDDLIETFPLECMNASYSHIMAVAKKIEEKLKSEGLDCIDLVEKVITHEIFSREEVELKSFKVIF